MNIDIPYDGMQEITVYTLRGDLNLLLEMSNGDYPPLFSSDDAVEKAKVKKLTKAYKTVLSYYGVDL